ncbi:MAG: ferrous iron transport protein A [Treponema sp.]|jgi:ferrous iron transport protein A|nr:ferrous iron transport protein A [Treponema sp.]
MLTLKEVKPGQTVRVKKLHGEGPVKRRIMDMGITRNTEILVRKAAPLGDPIEIRVRGYELSLRKADIDIIEVEGV